MGGEALDAPVLPPLPDSRLFCFDRTWKQTEAPLHRLYESRDAAQYRLYPFVDVTRSIDEMDELHDKYHAAGGHQPGTPGASTGYFFARALDRPVDLIPCALGASPLEMWTRGYSVVNTRGEVVTGLFEDLVDRVRAALGDDAAPAGVVWYQGESDAYDDRAPDYAERFARFVHDVRDSLGAPTLPFVTVQLGPSTVWPPELEPAWVEVRDQQRRAAAQVANVAIVTAADLTTTDGIHLTTASFETLGARLAHAAHRPAPNLASVTVDGARVHLAFSGVNGSLRLTGDHAAFHVEGAHVEAVEVDGACATLRLDQPVPPDAAVSYGAVYSPALCLVDEAGLPVPAFGRYVSGK